MKKIAIIAAALFAAPASAQTALPPITAITETAERLIRSTLIDPESARYEWPYDLATADDYSWTCGRYNAKNRMGGYGGAKWVRVYLRDNRVTVQTEEDNQFVNLYCERDVRDGKLRQRA